jgi:thioredoxin-related protein
MKNLSFFLFVLFFGACNSNVNNHEKTDVPDSRSTASINSRPDFGNVDSIEVYFFVDPAKQKEFTRLFITDKSSITALVENLDNQPVVMKECPHDGKIFFYRNGDVFKTVYISTADTCRYFAYAINATPHYVMIDDSAQMLISKFKSLAR